MALRAELMLNEKNTRFEGNQRYGVNRAERVGMNKVVKDLDDAWARARNLAAPVNAQRFDIQTPCKKTGSCADCKSPDTICSQFLVTRYSKAPKRIKVILVNDNLGY